MDKNKDQYVKVWVDCPYLKRRQTRFVDLDTLPNPYRAEIEWRNETLVRNIVHVFSKYECAQAQYQAAVMRINESARALRAMFDGQGITLKASIKTTNQEPDRWIEEGGIIAPANYGKDDKSDVKVPRQEPRGLITVEKAIS